MNSMKFLLDSDLSVAYQVKRDLMGMDDLELKSRISNEGFGKQFLEARVGLGWGERYYQPKWISTHYTMLDLRHLEIEKTIEIHEVVNDLENMTFCETGGTKFTNGVKESDVCVNGMMLNFMSYFKASESFLSKIVDYIIDEQMEDGGFNCQRPRSGAVHSSMHSTISVLEGIGAYLQAGYVYKAQLLKEIQVKAENFLLMHHLYKSDHSGEVIKKSFTMLSYPSRWYYDILRALKYFADYKRPYDERMEDAIDLLWSKRRKDDLWPVQKKHSGQVHFDMEKTGGPSAWNTYRALKVLKTYDHTSLLDSVLKKVIMNFNKNKIKYVIGGSLLFKAYGIVENCHDIDLVVDEKDHESAYDVLSKLGLSLPVKNSQQYETDHFFRFNIDGIEVEVMVNFKIKKDNKVYTFPYDSKSITEMNGYFYDDLHRWHQAYDLMGRQEVVDKIESYLQSKE